jgi:hypothetical protein
MTKKKLVWSFPIFLFFCSIFILDGIVLLAVPFIILILVIKLVEKMVP